MAKNLILEKTKEFVKKEFQGEPTGHDWWHIYRVLKTAIKIGKKEGADLFVVQLAALLHDMDDWKFNKSGLVGSEKARGFLKSVGVDDETASHVCHITGNVSFRGAGIKSGMKTKEGMVVQDADRLDAMGAIGIARCFATGQKFGNMIYDPEIKPGRHTTFEQYKNNKSTSINHFYEKLLLLKDRMNTKTGKKIAEQRHKFMEEFLARFYKEWKGKL